MANLTADASLRFRFPDQIKTEHWALDTSTAQTIFKGQPMIIDQDVDTVNLRGFVDATVVAPTDIFVGIALHGLAVLISAIEANNEVEVLTHGEIGFKSAVFTDADAGDPVYMSDSGTLSATAADNPAIGQLTRVADGYAYVTINPLGGPTVCAGA